jgi:hypothetical protein
MPQSNKSTAGLPNPHPIGLQSLSSILLGSLPLGLCWIHTPLGYPPLSSARPQLRGVRSTPWWDTRPSVVPCHSPEPVSWPPGSSSPKQCLTPALSPLPFRPCWVSITQGTKRPHPSGSQTFWPCWAPTPCGTTRAPCWDRHQLGWDRWVHQPAMNPTPWVEPAPAVQDFQITTPPGSCLGCH